MIYCIINAKEHQMKAGKIDLMNFGQPHEPEPVVKPTEQPVVAEVPVAPPAAASKPSKRGRPAKIQKAESEEMLKVISLRIPLSEFASLQQLAIQESAKQRSSVSVPDLVRNEITKLLRRAA
jgi:hypothetical protein